MLVRTGTLWLFVCIGLASVGLYGCDNSHNVIIVGNLEPSTVVRVDGKVIRPVRTSDLKPFGNENAEIKSPYSTLVIEAEEVVVTSKIKFKNIEGFIFVHDDKSPYVNVTNELEILDTQVSSRTPRDHSTSGLNSDGARLK